LSTDSQCEETVETSAAHLPLFHWKRGIVVLPFSLFPFGEKRQTRCARLYGFLAFFAATPANYFELFASSEVEGRIIELHLESGIVPTLFSVPTVMS
jgi:hypothetical protein